MLETNKKPFDGLERYISHSKILPGDMWYFGEKEFRIGHGGKKNELVIARVRVESPQRAQDSNRESVEPIECTSDRPPARRDTHYAG